MEFAEVTVKESPGLCRCCLSEGCYKDLGTEYAWMNETEVYADMLLDCFDIGITQHNDGPNGPKRLICEVCITRLRDACNFKKQVIDCEKKFIDMLGRGEFRVMEKQTVLLPLYSGAAPMKAETIEEVTVAEDYDDPHVEFLDDNDFTEDEELVKTEIPAPVASTSKRGRPKKSDSGVPEKKPKLKAKSKIAKDETPASKIDRKTSVRRRKNLKTIFDNTTIMPFKWRGTHICFYCSTPIRDYVEFRKHTKSHGECCIKSNAMKELKGNALAINVDVSEITCELCEQEFKSLEVIVEHLISEHGLFYDKEVYSEIVEYRLLDLRCTHCDLQFETYRSLVSHINKSHRLNTFICHYCDRKFNKKRDITSHIYGHHRLGGFICKQCGADCQSLFKLRKHTEHAHLARCHVCGKKFMYLKKLFKHVKLEHPSDNSKTCGYCMVEFHSAIGMKQHLLKCKVRILSLDENETVVVPESKNTVNTSRTHEQIVRIRENIQCVLNMSTAVPFRFRVKFSCFYCSMKHDDYEVLKQHTRTEHPVCDIKSKSMKTCKGKRTFVRVDIADLACKLCSSPMSDLEQFIDHAISVHNADYDKSVSIETCFEPYRLVKGNIPCLECPKVFRYLNTMLRHFNLDHSNNNVICDYCGRGFRSTTNLNMHLQNVHTGSSECKICHAKFKNRSILVRHMAKSHNEKTFKCANCSEMFATAYMRQLHLIKVHGIGHKCEYCGKMFTKHSFMDSHVRRTHLKEKNVTCSVCNDKFFDNHLLRMHMVKHDGERKFKCELCGKAFLRQKNLRTHMDTHKKYGFVQ